jgi:hypothetical protein
MLCSVELPIKYLNYLQYVDFDYIIASTCFEYPKYLEYFVNRKIPRFTILDNGAFETGEAVPDVQYLQLARIIKPNVLVIPDVLKDAQATLGRFNEFMQLNPLKGLSRTKLMGVVQAEGSTVNAEILGSTYSCKGVQWIGIPYVAELDRYRLIKKHPEWKNVHILGLPHLAEIQILKDLPNIKSVDCSLPINLSKEKKLLYFDAWTSTVRATPKENRLNGGILKMNLNNFSMFCHGEQLCR